MDPRYPMGKFEMPKDITPARRRAAIDVANQLGLILDEPLLIQETNHTVVWLRPLPKTSSNTSRRSRWPGDWWR